MKTYLFGIVPTLFSLWRIRYTDAFCIGTVVLTSFNYWRKPEKGFRRNIDMACVMSIGTYNMWKIPNVWGIVNPMCLGIWALSNYLDSLRVRSLIHIIPSIVYLAEAYFII